MRLLVLGGTRFVGYHMVEAAVRGGHTVTLFHRGKTGEVPPGVEEVKGDRRIDLDRLKGRRWDAVLDTCGYVPAAVEASARALAEAVDQYAFVSTISIYETPGRPGCDEFCALKPPPADPTTETISAETYGPLKVLCEQTLDRLLPGRLLHVRPGIVVGPRDTSDRFTYWVARVARGGEVLVPAPGDRPVQFIDARDLAEWTIRAIEQGLRGPYHLIGPQAPLGMAGLIDACRQATGSDATPVWVDSRFIAEAAEALELSRDFPFWLDAEDRDLFRLAPARAIATGLTYRPLGDTIRDTLAWLRETRPDEALSLGPSPAIEHEILSRWAARQA